MGLKDFLISTDYALGLSRVLRRSLKKNRSLCIMLHGVFPRKVPGIPDNFHFGLERSALIKFLEWVKRQGLSFLQYDEFLKGNPGIHLTFDDGYANNFQVALPVLEDFCCPATIFVTTGHLGSLENPGPLLSYFSELASSKSFEIGENSKFVRENWQGLAVSELKALSEHPLIEIGNHTINHPNLSLLSKIELEKEIVGAQEVILSLTGVTPRTFSYPYGLFDERVTMLLKSLNFESAFSVNNKVLGVPEIPYQIPRIGIYKSSNPYLSFKLNFFKSALNTQKLHEYFGN